MPVTIASRGSRRRIIGSRYRRGVGRLSDYEPFKPFKQARNDSLGHATPEAVKSRKAARIKELRERIKRCEQQIKDATEEIEKWENL